MCDILMTKDPVESIVFLCVLCAGGGGGRVGTQEEERLRK